MKISGGYLGKSCGYYYTLENITIKKNIFWSSITIKVDGNNLIKVVRDQIGKGADFIKVYADYRWGLKGDDQPSFTLEELKTIMIY